MGMMKIAGIVVASVSAFAIVILLIVSIVLPAGAWMGAKDAEEEYDNWAKTAEIGDEITISGKIAEEESESLLGISIYSYTLEGCKLGFVSSEDLGNEGDNIVVTVQVTQMGPEASSAPKSFVIWAPNLCCGGLMGILFIVGLALFLISVMKKKG